MSRNSRQKSNVLFRIILAVIVVGVMVFIFKNSSEIGSFSSQRSSIVTTNVNQIIKRLSLPLFVTEGFIRKLAHVLEYALLGLMLTLALRMFTRRVVAFIAYPLFFGILIPVCDELLQTFTPGRSGTLKDVIIDFSGVVIGIVVGLVLIAIFQKIFSKNPRNNIHR